MKKLKRFVEEASLAVRVLILWVLIAALPTITFALVHHLDGSFLLAGLLAAASLPAVLACWLATKLVVWLIDRATRFLWKLRAFRLMIWSACAAAAFLLASWNLSVSGDLAWLGILSEAIALAAFGVAARLAGRPFKLEETLLRQRMRIPASWNRPIRYARVAARIFVVALVDLWLYASVEEWLAGNWFSIPWNFLGDVRIELAWIAPTVFTLAALLAGSPYLRRAAPRWIFTISRPSTERQEQSRRIFGRKPFYSLEHVRKVVTIVLPDGRPAEAGERFVLARTWWTGCAFVTVLSVAVLSGLAKDFIADKPQDLSGVAAYQPVVSTIALDRHGRHMCTFTLENRIYVPLKDIPRHVQDAFIGGEDQRFWEHYGFDPIGIARAAKANFDGGATSQGASTLDQQVIKQIILKDSSKSYGRKISEILLAVRLEKQMTAKYGRRGAKEQILEVYLNHVYLGKGFYGVEAASQGYFGKSAKDLSLAEAAILAGLPKAPARDSPDGHFDRAKKRQLYVLGRMLKLGSITRAQFDAALAEEIVNIRPSHQLNATAAPYACEEVRRLAEKTFGYDAVYKRGLLIDTTIHLERQEEAQASVHYGLLDLERRLGFAGPEGHDDAGDRCEPPAEWVADNAIEPNARVIARDKGSLTLCVRGNRFDLDPDDVKRVRSWEGAKSGRSVRIGDFMTVRIETRQDARYALTARRTGGLDADGKPHYEALQAALVAIDPSTGEILAIVGGYDWSEIQFDIATQARRQTGSSIKPYVYLSALMKGETVVSKVLDAPICLSTASGPWRPSNYDNGKAGFRAYYGNVDLMTALAKSLNSVSVRLLVEVGLDQALATIRALGVRSKIERVFPIAVGSPELTLLEHTAAYATILNNGRALPIQHSSGAPGLLVTKVSERHRRADGVIEERILFEAKPQPIRQAVPSGDAYAMTFLMKGVVEHGTGTRAKRLRRPVAGKTGTTNSFRDVWFIGGTADLVVGVWVGRLTPEPIVKEATGGSVALPIWEGFMEAAHPVTEAAPARDFPISDEVTLVDQGERRDGIPILLPFQRGKMPQTYLTAPAADFGADPFE